MSEKVLYYLRHLIAMSGGLLIGFSFAPEKVVSGFFGLGLLLIWGYLAFYL
jgi:hypothetical protein